MYRIRARLSYANVMVTVLACIVLTGGGAIALGSPRASESDPSTTVAAAGPWHVVGASGQPNFNLTAACLWRNFDSVHSNAAFVRDSAGFVHLKGTVVAADQHNSGACHTAGFNNELIFVLPRGYRPARREAMATLIGALYGPADQSAEVATVTIDGPSITALPAGAVSADREELGDGIYLSLDGISFRCAPAGKNGCP